MNEFDAWYKILEEWKTIKRTKRLIQELYEQVGGTLFFKGTLLQDVLGGCVIPLLCCAVEGTRSRDLAA